MASNNQRGSSVPGDDDYFEITFHPVIGSSMTVLRSVRVRHRETVEVERTVSVSQRCRIPIALPHNPMQSRPRGTNNGKSSTMRTMSDDWKKALPKDSNLILVLKKELSNSDVASLGRIVLPKREAEAYLPTLNDKDGIKLEMQDMHSNRMLEFKYRFWPNNKSRMYVLEHAGKYKLSKTLFVTGLCTWLSFLLSIHCLLTGDFLKSYKLKPGDILLILKDMNDSKLMITFARSPPATGEGEGTQAGCSANGNDDSTIQPHQTA